MPSRGSRNLTIASAIALTTVVACSGSSGPSSTGQPSTTETVSAPASPTTTPSLSSTPSPTTTAAATGGGRLAYAAGSHMFVQQVSTTGRLVGKAKQVGPADPTSQPMWSPLGRYLVWQHVTNGPNPPTLELYDSTQGQLRAYKNLSWMDYAAAGVGLQVVKVTDDTDVDNALYNTHGPAGDSGSGTFQNILSVVVGGHQQVIVETGQVTNSPATLWLLPSSGPRVKLGTVQPLAFLGEHNAPGIGYRASTNDGTTTAIVTALGQDGGCANGQDVHVLDLVQHTDTVVPLPLKRGTLQWPSYSPSNVLGGISADCGYEGNDKKNKFVELHGSSWTTVVPGATIGARGPNGLLAVQLGTFHAHEYTPEPSQDHPLEIRDSSGRSVSSLPTSWSAAWTQAAVPPASP